MKRWAHGLLVAALACAGLRAQTTDGDFRPGTLRPAAAMSGARAAHTATPLANGDVLIVGGFAREGAELADVELFDAAQQRFVPTGQATIRRQSHTATRLRNGSVLITGGLIAGNLYTATAELYDPAVRTFRSVGPMTAARSGHEAVLLPDGRVLIAGGVGIGWTFLSSAEIFDPRTERFLPTGSMSEPRESHVALLLRDGHVLVAGGHRGRGGATVISQSAELYDPATGSFTQTGSMLMRRHKHDGIVLRTGQVLIIGGADERDARGVYSSLELYDPELRRFALQGSLQEGRYKHRGTTIPLANGRLLFAGGATVAEEYDPVTGRSMRVAADEHLRGQFSAAAPLPGGAVLISGGYAENRGPARETWMFIPAAPSTRPRAQ